MAAETILSVLQHALGVDEYGRGRQYRNHFVCGEGHHSYDACLDATDHGLMVRRESGMFGANGSCFLVTDAGREWMAENSPSPPKLSRSQQRYQSYLDADCGVSFGEWLKWRASTGTASSELPF